MSMTINYIIGSYISKIYTFTLPKNLTFLGQFYNWGQIFSNQLFPVKAHELDRYL